MSRTLMRPADRRRGEPSDRPRATKPRLVVADDHVPLLAAVQRLLAAEFDVVRTARDGRTALRAVADVDPDAAVLDLSMPELDGIEVARRLRAARSRTEVVVLTVHDDADLLRAALEAGAVGYVLKSRMSAELVPAIRAALAGRIFVSPVRGAPGS
jgi:DNA-binding NarL/FixJ family response regulator